MAELPLYFKKYIFWVVTDESRTKQLHSLRFHFVENTSF